MITTDMSMNTQLSILFDLVSVLMFILKYLGNLCSHMLHANYVASHNNILVYVCRSRKQFLAMESE